MTNKLVLLVTSIIIISHSSLSQTITNNEIQIDTTINVLINPKGPEYTVRYRVTQCDDDGACATAQIEIYKNGSGIFQQQWSDSLSYDYPFVTFAETPKFIDFNFDGYLDICFEGFISGVRPEYHLMSFRQFNTTTNSFEGATQFDKMEGSITISDYDATIEEYISLGCGQMCWIKNYYKYNDKILVFVNQVESFWDEKEHGYVEIVRKIKTK
jgi:hypothetical protein